MASLWRNFYALFRANAFIRNSLVLFLGTMVMNALNYIFHVVIGRMVEPTVYGEIESLISLFAIVSVPAGALILIATKFSAGTKAEGDPAGAREIFRYLNKKIFFYGLPLFFLALMLTPWVQRFLHLESSFPIFVLWGAMLLAFFGAVVVGILNGWQKFGVVNRANIWSTSAKLLSAIVFVSLGFGVNGVMGSLFLSGLVGYGIAVAALHFFRSDMGAEKNKKVGVNFSSLKKFILPAFVGTLSITLLGNVDMVFAKHILIGEAAGEYSALSITARTIFFATGVITTVLFAMASEKHHQASSAAPTFWLAFGLTCLIAVGSIILFSLFPEWVLSLFFGDKYLHVGALLGWFALAASLYALANLFLQYLLSLGQNRAVFYFLALSSLEILLLFFFGTSAYAIITVTISAQLIAVVLGFVFILTQKLDGQENFDRYPSLQ